MSNEANKQFDPNFDFDHLDGIDANTARDFIKNNPGDYDRIRSALGGDNEDSHHDAPGGGGSAPSANWESMLSQWKGMQPAAMGQFNEQFNAPGRRATSTAEWGGGNFAAPQLKDIADWTKSFTAPTEADMKMDPGYQFRVNEARRQLEASAAAKGTLLTGGTMDAMGRLAQDYASQEYGNVYNRRQGEFQDEFNMFNTGRNFDAGQNTDKYGRALQTFGTNYGLFGNERQNAQMLDESDYGRAASEYGQRANIFQSNEANRYNSERQNMMDMFGIDTGLYGRDFGERQQGFTEEMGRGNLALQTELGRGNLALGQGSLALQGELGRGNLGLGQQQFDLSKILGLGGMNQNQQQINNQASQFGQNFGEGQRMNSFNMFNTMDQNYINNLMNMGQLGLQANGQQAGSGGNIGDFMTQIGNALAAGRVGQGNAYGGAAGQTGNNIANSAQYAQLASILRNSSYGTPLSNQFTPGLGTGGVSGYGNERFIH